MPRPLSATMTLIPYISDLYHRMVIHGVRQQRSCVDRPLVEVMLADAGGGAHLKLIGILVVNTYQGAFGV